VFTDKIHTIYKIVRSRGSKVPLGVLGEDYKGVAGSDFYSAYSPLPFVKQKCHVHLLRELHEVGQKNGSEEFLWFKQKVKRLLNDSVRLKVNRGKYDEFTFQRRLNRLKECALELNDVEYADPDSTRLAVRVAKHADELFTFVEHDEVDKNNNLAERKIRPNVVIRKVSAGNRSDEGAKAHETLMSLTTTCKDMEIDWFEYGKTVLKNLRDGVNQPVIVNP